MEHDIQHRESGSQGVFFIERSGGGHLAEITYSRTNASPIVLDHTEVDRSLAGQGVGRKLLDALVGWARGAKTKVVPLRPFAKAQFDAFNWTRREAASLPVSGLWRQAG